MGPKPKKEEGKNGSVEGFCRVSKPTSLKPEKYEYDEKKTVWESIKGTYLKNQLESRRLKK